MNDSLKSKLIFAIIAIGIPLMLLGQAVTIKKTSDYPNNPHPSPADLFLIARTGVTNFNIRYDQLFSNVNVQGTSTINNLYVSNAYITNLYASNAFFTNLTVFENTYTSNLYATNIYASNAYITNLTFEISRGGKLTITNVDVTYVNATTNFYFYSTNLFVDNTYVSNYFATNVFNNNYVSNYLFTNVFVTNQYVTNLYSTNVVNNNTTVSNFWQTNIFVTDSFVSNYFTTNIFNEFVTNIYNSFSQTIITNLYVTTNLTVQNTYTTNLYATYINPVTNYYFYDTNLYVNNSYVSNYFTTNVFNDTYVSNYVQQSFFTTNVYTTNLYSTNIINNNSYVSNFWQTNIFVTDTTVSNYFATNLFVTYVTNINNTISEFNSTNVTLYGDTRIFPVSPSISPGALAIWNSTTFPFPPSTNFVLRVMSDIHGPQRTTPAQFTTIIDRTESTKIALDTSMLAELYWCTNLMTAGLRTFSETDNAASNSIYTLNGSYGVLGRVYGSQLQTPYRGGEQIGVAGNAESGANIQYGLMGRAISYPSIRTNGTNVGVIGFVGTRANTGVFVPGYFEALTNTSTTLSPNYESSIVLIDNRDSRLPLITARTNNGGQVFLVDANGVVYVNRSLILQTNSWVGPTNTLNLLYSDQYYNTLGNVEVTNITGLLPGYSHSVQLSINNVSGSNVQVVVPSTVIQADGATGSIWVTNATERIFWFKARIGRTNLVHRSF